ncbi:MAG TPA: TonB family protein [Edaphobacter sp.]|nr:TonB family protein [Edaphobacter sp.]
MTLVLEETVNYDQAVKRFRSLCDMHRIPCGGAGDLRQLLTALKQDRHFAMDFWAMVGELSARERGSLSDDEMVAMIVEGSSGKTVQELPLSEKVATAELKNLLAGIDVDAPLIEDVAPESAPEPPVDRTPVKVDLRRVEAVVNPEPRRIADPARASIDAAQAKTSVEEALRRLEETSRELREQLAALAVGERLRHEAASANASVTGADEFETEPVVEEVAGYGARQRTQPEQPPIVVAQQAAPLPATTPDPVPPAEPVLAPRRPLSVREERAAFAAPPFSMLSHRGFQPRDADDDPSIPIPLAEYAEANRRRIGAGTILLIILVAALIVGGYTLYKGYGDDQVADAKAAFLHKLGLFGTEIHDLASPSDHPGATPQPVPAASQQSAPLQPAPQRPQASAPQPAPPQQGQNTATVKSNTARPVAGSEVVARAAARPEPMPMEPGAVRVAPSVMQENLLSSRVAVYPESARVRGIQGPVEVEAVVSRAGNVEYAHAVSGDPHLRAAAEEAVLRWKFKPYLVNGTPVQAVTQVRINFRLR